MPSKKSLSSVLFFGTWRSPVAHLHGVQGVVGSNPAVPTYYHITLLFRTVQPVLPGDFSPAPNGNQRSNSDRTMSLSRKLRYGMVGGGPGAFIGEVHRKAAALDGLTILVAGAFSSNPSKSQQQGEVLHLDPARVYGSFEEMAEREAALPEDERIDFVSVVTPNFMHFPVAKAFIERGIHVVCDKPMTTTLEEAEELCRLVAAHDVVFALTHNYTGYPMVKQARAMVQNGELGEIHKVVVEYPQGWLATKLEDTGSKQAAWRTDPSKGRRVVGGGGYRFSRGKPCALYHRPRNSLALR